jgi:hypothetical protein
VPDFATPVIELLRSKSSMAAPKRPRVVLLDIGTHYPVLLNLNRPKFLNRLIQSWLFCRGHRLPYLIRKGRSCKSNGKQIHQQLLFSLSTAQHHIPHFGSVAVVRPFVITYGSATHGGIYPSFPTCPLLFTRPPWCATAATDRRWGGRERVIAADVIIDTTPLGALEPCNDPAGVGAGWTFSLKFTLYGVVRCDMFDV